MKKKILILLFFLIIISCKKVENIAQQNNTDIVKIHGYIEKKIASQIWDYGTHVLRNSNGDILYAIISENINLDLYMNDDVYIEGFMVAGYPKSGGPEFLKVTFIK